MFSAGFDEILVFIDFFGVRVKLKLYFKPKILNNHEAFARQDHSDNFQRLPEARVVHGRERIRFPNKISRGRKSKG
jgi:hypothetical protein